MTDRKPFTSHSLVRHESERRDAHRWEHMQIDVPVNLQGHNQLVIYTFVDPLLDLVAEVQEGLIVDFRLLSEVALEITSIPPPFNLADDPMGEAEEHSPIFRSWRIPSFDMTVHVESWVEKNGGGFVDVFGRRG